MDVSIALAGLAFALSAMATWVLARQFNGTTLMDSPNERSSHTIPRPRGGGLAIMGAAIVCMSLLHGLDFIRFETWFAFALIGLGVGLSGFLDDQRLVTLEFRLMAQFIAALAGLALIRGFPPLDLGFMRLDLGWGNYALGVVFLIWMMNLFNFMDGIDGLAASEASFVSLVAAGLAYFAGLEMRYIAPTLILAGAAAGFLIWNYPPARIFMGTVGSEFLGYFIGLLAIRYANVDQRMFWAVVILCAVFVTDATMTLLMRLAKGENVFQAHRTHVYQYLAISLGAHRPVTLGIWAINLLWLAPLAWTSARGLLPPVIATLVAYAPLVVFAFFYRKRAARTLPSGSA